MTWKQMGQVMMAVILCGSFSSLNAESSGVRKPFTTDDIARALRMNGGNFEFSFDTPVYAKITVVADGDNDKQTTFIQMSDKANAKVNLFFQESPMFVGSTPSRTNRDRAFAIRLSDCKEGTRIYYYTDKFQGIMPDVYRWELPEPPPLDKPLMLFRYFLPGETYEAKVTITFSKQKPE